MVLLQYASLSFLVSKNKHSGLRCVSEGFDLEKPVIGQYQLAINETINRPLTHATRYGSFA
jgi:hypothetical protein